MLLFASAWGPVRLLCLTDDLGDTRHKLVSPLCQAQFSGMKNKRQTLTRQCQCFSQARVITCHQLTDIDHTLIIWYPAMPTGIVFPHIVWYVSSSIFWCSSELWLFLLLLLNVKSSILLVKSICYCMFYIDVNVMLLLISI